MSSAVETKSPVAVCREVQQGYLDIFPNGNPTFVPSAFAWASDCFCGRYKDYQPIDARYHDFEHTLQGTLCFAQLLQGYARCGAAPKLTQRQYELGLLSILLHDTGYLKKNGDNEGTGAKYTLTHVQRSADFAEGLLREKGFAAAEIHSVQNMIRCTGVNVDLALIPFGSELEKRVGYALGTADLLGQMAAQDYVEKLDILFEEFEESARHNGRFTGSGIFSSVEDLRNRTPGFWDRYVLPKINGDFLGLHRYLGRPAPSDEHGYIQRIRANLERLRAEFQPQSA